MTGRTLMINGVELPRFLYGTAWKEGRTGGLTELALQTGVSRHRHGQPAPPLSRGGRWAGDLSVDRPWPGDSR